MPGRPSGHETGGLRERVAALEALVAELTARLAQRDARVSELERLLAEARRSGKRQAAPFSKGDPEEAPKRPGRKSGEAHGRHGHRMRPAGPLDRELAAPLPDHCPDCGGEIELERVAEQVQADLPEPRPVLTRFAIEIGHCRSCRRRIQGRHLEQTSDALGAAASQVGPLAKSWATWLHYGLGLSFKKTAQLLARLGIHATAGALCQAAQSSSFALVPVQAEIVAQINDAPMVVADETGWRVGGGSAWLWAATTPGATAYWVANGRGYEEACQVIEPDFSGVLVRDGWGPYRLYNEATHQTCLGHLLRRSDELIKDLPEEERETPRAVRAILIDSLKARDLGPRKRKAAATKLTERIEAIVDAEHAHDENRKLAKHLGNEKDALFTFLTNDRVDATNWRGEQAVRPAAVNRKVWGGNRTWRGAATQGRVISVIRTASQQGVTSSSSSPPSHVPRRRRTFRRSSADRSALPAIRRRDVTTRYPSTGVLAGHPRRDDVHELDERNVAVAGQATKATGLDGVEVLQADAGITDSCVGAVPAQIVIACGIFRNITVSEVQATVAALPSLCAPEALVLWTRHRVPPDLTTMIRSWFREVGFREEDFDVSDDGFMSVGAHRLMGEPSELIPGQRLFTFAART